MSRAISKSRRRGVRQQRGVALITSLILLLLMTAMGTAMYLSVNSDMMINGYYRNFRGSFYGADSGLNIARQDLAVQLENKVSTTFDTTTGQPIPAGVEPTVISYINSTYGAAYQALNASSAWPSKYQVKLVDAPGFATNGLQLLDCTVTGGSTGSTCTNHPYNPDPKIPKLTAFNYRYRYHLLGTGRTTGTTQKTTLEETGQVTITVNVAQTPDSTVSFAAYGMFIDKYDLCSTSPLVQGTITGEVFTNGAWNFGTGNYIFTDPVGSANKNAGYVFDTSKTGCDPVAGPKDTRGSGRNAVTIAPTFKQGFTLGEATRPVPENDYNQERAVLDSMGKGTTQPTKSELNASLRDASKNPYPMSGKNGVYLPYSIDASTGAATFNGGGLYVEGDAGVSLTPGTTTAPDGSTLMQQTYTITQGKTPATTTTITMTFNPSNPSDPNNTTKISSTATPTPVTIAGVPVRRDPDNGQIEGVATMLYVNGNITSLNGPGPGQPAIQDGTALTITASQNITITGDVTYATEPVTMKDDQIPGTLAGTLIPSNNKQQTLGIFTAGGNIQLNNTQRDSRGNLVPNLEIDASLAAISQAGTSTLVNTGSAITTLTIVGGRIQSTINNINSTTRNVFFDRRYAQGGFAPPFFPSTTVTHNATDSPTGTIATFQRLQWLNKTTY